MILKIPFGDPMTSQVWQTQPGSALALGSTPQDSFMPAE